MSEATGSVPTSEVPSAPAESSRPAPSSSAAPPESTTALPPPEEESTSALPPPASSSVPPAEPSSTAAEPEESSSVEVPTSATSQEPPAPSEPVESSSTLEDPIPSSDPTSDPVSSEPVSSIITITSSDAGGSNVVITVTSTRGAPTTSSTNTATTGQPLDSSNKSQDEGLSKGATVAIGVVVPIVAIAILAIAGLFFWKKRKARMHAEEERRKEVEDYSYNPNADPTIPSVAMMSDNGYDMREDTSSGYRGWGNTVVGSTGRKASTTISGGAPYSDTTSPTYGNSSEARSGEPLMDSYSGDGEILGAMGPSAAHNRGGDVHRGPSNASSSYSAAGRSDASDPPVGVAYGSGAGYYESYGQNPYSDNNPRPQEAPGAPVIRDNPARRNTRIENASHFPQGSVGISQNF